MSNVILASIRIDGGTQPRTQIDETLVAEYAAAMRDGAPFPPVVLFHDGVELWLADGFHRYHAALKAEWRDINADVRTGTKRDAVLFSVGANAGHGLRRTNADKRKAVLTLLNDAEWSQWSAEEIARRCGVSATLVKDTRSSLAVTSSEPSVRTYTTKHGTIATMKTEHIGTPFKSRDAVQHRREALRSLAESGHSAAQIAAATGYAEKSVPRIAKSLGVVITAAQAVGRSRKHDGNRIVENIVMDAENLTAGIGLVTFSALDRARLQAWIDSLVQSRRSLDSFIRKLKEHASVEARD